VRVEFCVALLLLVELAAVDSDPLDDPAVTDVGPFTPIPDIVDHRIADIRLDSGIVQPMPSFF
jgi:hypothetical protein